MKWWLAVAWVCRFLENRRPFMERLHIPWPKFYYLIYDREEDQPYLHRHYLLSTRWLEKWFPKLSYRLVLHKCVKSDIDGLHDHPWEWGAKLLDGAYYEVVPSPLYDDGEKRIYRLPGEWRFRTAHDFHRLELASQGYSWSLFLMGPRNQKEYNAPWGFLDRDGNWVPHWEYIENREKYI